MGILDPDTTVAGFKISTIVGGAAGSFVAALTGKEGVWSSILTVIVGTICAAFLTPYALRLGSQFLYFSPAEEQAMAFLVGLTGKGLANIALRVVARLNARSDAIVDSKLGSGK